MPDIGELFRKKSHFDKCPGLLNFSGNFPAIIIGLILLQFGLFAAEWKLGTPIVTYWAGPGFPGETKMTDIAARQMAEGGWNLVWCSSKKDLDIVHRNGLRGLFFSNMLSSFQKKQIPVFLLLMRCVIRSITHWLMEPRGSPISLIVLRIRRGALPLQAVIRQNCIML